MPAIDRALLDRLEATLHAEIPLTRAMGVRVAGADDRGLTLAAPLTPNLNHKRTVFGGSLATLATLAGWGLLHLLLREHQPVTVVIQQSAVQYLRPVAHDFEATCEMPAAPVLDRFLATLKRRGVARIELDVTIATHGESAVEFRGRFVAFDKIRHPRIEPV